MYVKIELNGFEAIKNNSWSGAIDTLIDIENAEKEDDFMNLLESYFENNEDAPTETEVNDFIWFERNFIYENLGLNENGKLIEDKDYSEE